MSINYTRSFTCQDPHYQLELRPAKRVQRAEQDSEAVPGTKRLTGEESWTKLKPCQLDSKSSRALKENLDLDRGKPPELHEVRRKFVLIEDPK